MLPMHVAARENKVEEMQNLIVTGKYDINEKDFMKRTPLHMASWAGNVEIVKLLIRSKAKTDAIANDNFTALHFATNVEVIKQLVKSNKALLHTRVSKGNKTALHIAVSKGNIEIVQCLIDLGSDVTAKTSSGQSCLELAKNDEIYSLIKNILQNKIEKQQEIIEKRTGAVVVQTSDAEHKSDESSSIESKIILPMSETSPEKKNDIMNIESSSDTTSSSSANKNKNEEVNEGHINDALNNTRILSNEISCSVSLMSPESGKEIKTEIKNNADSVLGKKNKINLTALERRKKKVKANGGSNIMLSHLNEDEEDG